MPWIETPDLPVPGLKAKARTTERPRYEIRNAAGETAELLLFDEIGGWFGSTAEDVIAELKGITASKLTVKVNSPGGSVFEGIALANALRAHPAEVTVQVEGLAASIASVIALAGDRLLMAPHSMLMIHEAAGGCLGNSADMHQMAGLLDKISDNIADAYAAKAGGSAEEWRTRMRAETWYSADEAVAAGLADEVLRAAKPTEEVAARTFDLSVFNYSGRAEAPAPVIDQRPADPVREELPAEPVFQFDPDEFRRAFEGVAGA